MYPRRLGVFGQWRVKMLQVNMKNIRKKMGVTPGEKHYIINALGVGYRMKNFIHS